VKRIQKPKVGDRIEIPNLGKFEVAKIFEGGHNRIVFKAVGNGVAKVIKIFGETVEIAVSQATSFIRDIYMYRQTLEDLGVKVPPLSDIQIVTYQNQSSGKLNITEISPFYGESFEDLILKANKEGCLKLQKRIFKCLGNLFEKSPGELLQVGIDLVPRNFTGNGNDWYIDLVPPKLRKNGSFQLEIPEVKDPICFKIGVDRHYRKSEIVRVLLVQLCKLRPELYPYFLQGIEDFLSEKGENEVKEIFRQRLAAREIKANNEDIKLISALKFVHIYDLREIACIYAFNSLISPKELREFFSLSHFQDKPLPAKAIKQLKDRLIKAL